MKRVLLTGASSGIGRSLYDTLITRVASGGPVYKVVGVGHGGPDLEMDFSNAHNVYDAVHTIEDMIAHERYDVLINNAGYMHTESFAKYPAMEMDRSLHVNLIAPFLLMQAFLKQPPRLGLGCLTIVNMASMVVKQTSRECPGYVASKAGLEAMTRAAAREYACRDDIKICSVAPALVGNTAMSQNALTHLTGYREMTDEAARDYMTPPTGRPILISEVVDVVLFAIENMPRAMTGTTLYIPSGSGV